MKISLDLHKEGILLLLDSQDIYEYIGESTTAELELAYYIDRWCEYLNYPLFHNDDLKFGDPDLAKLEGWITGFNHAKKINPCWKKGFVSFRYGKHTITLKRPFKI